MHILLIHQAFVSPREPGGTRHYELARQLVEKGHRVTIIASDISYLTGQQTVLSCRLVHQESIDGIRVLRSYTYPELHRSFAWRVVSFLSFMISSVLASLRVHNIDLVMGTSPPIFQAVAAWLVAAMRRRPFVLEIRDLWPEFAIDMGVLKCPVLIYLSRRLEHFLYGQASHFLVNSPAYRDYLLNKGIAGEDITFIPNGVDPDLFNPQAAGKTFRREFKLDEKFVVTYAGALGLANDIPTILRAAQDLRNERTIHFLLVGDGKERVNSEKLAKQLNLSNVTFAGSRPKSDMGEILAASDACLAILQNIPMFSTTYPNKVFDYMAAGRPTILAIDGVIREVIESAQGGIFVPPGNDMALAEAVRGLSNDRAQAEAMGRAARSYVVENFNRHQHSRRFAHLVEYVAKQNRAEHQTFYRSCGKRSLDLVFSMCLTVLLIPLLLLLAIFVRLKLGSPILFRQQRPGLQGRPFTIYKFRTMTDSRDQFGNLLPDAERLTSFGQSLRSTSLDELPELFNVLKGDMSLVGPRPLLLQYLERYTSEQARRHDVKPGITGWAQVNGRNAITWQDKFKFDVWYVDNQSLSLDLKIVALTAWKILKREGITQSGQATAEEFNPQITQTTDCADK